MVFSHPESIQNAATAPQLAQTASRSLGTSVDTSAIVPPLCHSSCQSHRVEVFTQTFSSCPFQLLTSRSRGIFIFYYVFGESSPCSEHGMLQNPNFPAAPCQQSATLWIFS